jgi:hypothetical protein
MTLRYVQSKDGVFVRHINDIEPTQWDENNFCFARKLTPEQALQFGVTKLQIVTPPYFDPATQRREEGPAVLDDGVWVQQYVVTDLTAEEAIEKAGAQATEVRAARDGLLVASDWTQLSDSTADKPAWATYRQDLRDITAQAGFPWTINWPTQPE